MQSKPKMVDVFEREGFELKRSSRAFWLSCPFHEDQHPSLKINPERQVFYCFGCGEHGDAITFVQKLHGLSFKDACNYLNLKDNSHFSINPKARTKRDLLSVTDRCYRANP